MYSRRTLRIFSNLDSNNSAGNTRRQDCIEGIAVLQESNNSETALCSDSLTLQPLENVLGNIQSSQNQHQADYSAELGMNESLDQTVIPLVPVQSDVTYNIEPNGNEYYTELQTVQQSTSLLGIQPIEYLQNLTDEAITNQEVYHVSDGSSSCSNDMVPNEEADYVQLSTDVPSSSTIQPSIVDRESIETNELGESSRKKRIGGGRKKVDEEERTRKRVKKEESWAHNIRKNNKERGLAYQTKSGKSRRAKLLQKPCQCKMKCFNKLSETQRQHTFNEFHKLNRHGQDQFIAETVDEFLKNRERVPPEKQGSSRRNYSRKYFLKAEGNSKIEICQKMYLGTLDLTVKKVRVIVEKKRKNEGLCPTDARGKHQSHKKIDDESKNIIRSHIESIPAYTSHYSRARTSKKYLNPDLSISLLYRLYCVYCQEKDIIPQLECQYRKIFNEEYNLSFHHPANDTCSKCDKLHQELKTFNNIPEPTREQQCEKQKLEAKISEHQTLAETAYKNKSEDRELSKIDQSVITVSFDLEKCLPTPFLKNGLSFYKRQLWTFNLTLYTTSISGSTGTCFIWDETKASRGGFEIASCVRKFVLSLPKSVKKINFYSDSCTGQNKNIYMITMFCVLMQELKIAGSSVTEINHKFLEPGHTHMEADTIHAAIESAKKKTTVDIEVPHDWSTFIINVYRKSPLNVIEMQQSDFFNFGDLLKNKLVHRKKNEQGEIIPWMQIKWLKFQSQDDYVFQYSTSFESNFIKVDLRRGSSRNRAKDIEVNLKPVSSDILPLAELKVKDLLELLPFISHYNRPFYENLRVSTSLDPDELPTSEHSQLNETDFD